MEQGLGVREESPGIQDLFVLEQYEMAKMDLGKHLGGTTVSGSSDSHEDNH
jgi:hypothetical protein